MFNLISTLATLSSIDNKSRVQPEKDGYKAKSDNTILVYIFLLLILGYAIKKQL